MSRARALEKRWTVKPSQKKVKIGLRRELRTPRQKRTGFSERKDLCCIGAIKTEFEREETKTEELLYLQISSRNLTALELAHHARMEWAVETMHWILDVHCSEDYCRIVSKTIQQNLNMLRKFALSLMKQFKAITSSKHPVSQIMFYCLLDLLTISFALKN